MRIFILLFMLAPLFLWGQYPDNPRKLRLGFQTTGAGLTYIKDGAPVHTPGDDEDAWMVLDTANNVLYYWDETAGAWENILDDITQDTVFQITNVPDTTTLAPMQGDAFINSTADTLGLYNGAGWVLFFGGTGVTDGDKGDIDVSGSGATWVVDTGVVTTIKLADNAVTAAKIATGEVGADELASTAVTPGSYTYSSFTVDADGRVTAASSGTTPLTGSLSSGYLPYATGAITLANSTLYRNGSGDIGLNEASPLATFHLQTRSGANALIVEDDNLSTLGPAFYVTAPGQTTSGTNGTELFWVVGGPGSGGNLDGPYFAIRGNTYTRLSNQRGHMAFVAGNVSSPVGNDGTVYFLTGSGSTGMALFPTGRMGVNVFPPAYTLDVGGTGAALRLAPHSTALTNAGGLLSFKSGDNWFLGRDGTNEFFFAKSSVSSFTTGSLLFAGTSGQATQDNSNLFWDDTGNRLHIGGNNPTARLHLPAGTATASTAPLKFTLTGHVPLTTPEAGVLSPNAAFDRLAYTNNSSVRKELAFTDDIPGTLYSVNGTIPDGRVATVEIAGTFTLRNLDGFIKIGDDQGDSSGSAITIDNDSEDVIVNAYSHRLQGPTHDPALLGILEAGVRVLKLGDHEDVGNSTTIQLYDDTEIIRLHADSAISMKGTSYDYMFPKANPGVNQVLGEGATDDNQLEWMDMIIDGGMTDNFLPRYDETSGTLVDSDIEDDGTTITAGFSRDEVEIIPLNSITMFVDNDSINIYGPVTRIGSTDNDTYVRVVDSSPTLVDAKAEEIHLTGEIYAPALSEYSGGGYYNIVQLPGTKEIRYDTVYTKIYGYLYGTLDSIALTGATDQTSITGWTEGGYNSGHFTATDSSLIYNGPTRRVEVQFDGKLIGGAAGDVEIRIGYSTSAGSGTLVLPADQTERITLTGGSTRDQFYTSCQMQLADGYEIKARGARGDFGIREARLRVMQID